MQLERVRGSGRVGCDQLQYVVNTQNAEFLETSGFDDDVCPSWRRRSLKSEMVDFDLPALIYWLLCTCHLQHQAKINKRG